MERLWLKPPILLEVEGAGAALAAAVVEHAYAPLAGAAHQVPLHEIVARDLPRLLRPAAVVGEHLVAEVKGHHACNEPPVPGHRQHLAVGAEDLPEDLEIAPGKNRGAEAVDALRVSGEESLYAFFDLALQPCLDPLAHHSPLQGDQGR